MGAGSLLARKLGEKNKSVLDRLSKKYKLLMVGAGACKRIFNQMNEYPIDIIGNYGMQYAKFEDGALKLVRDDSLPCRDRSVIEEKVTAIRKKHGFTVFAGDNVEYHASGCLTFPILGTKAVAADKLAFDPDRKKRRAF